MWNHLAIVAVAATMAVVSAEGLMALDHFDHAQSATTPARSPVSSRASGGDAQVVKAEDGHFWAEANVDGRRVRLLVDTGATAVALTLADAKRLGVDTDRLSFNQSVRTASGEAKAAQIELDYVSVAGARVDKVQALVLDHGLSASLLGMTYLGRLSRFEATPQSLILRP